jgi:hypothetical protein
MATLHHNISGALTKQLLAPGDIISPSKISLANTNGSNVVAIDLYIEKKLTGKFYLVKGLSLPSGAAYVYSGVSFDNKADQFGLYIKLTGTSPTVDVIIS